MEDFLEVNQSEVWQIDTNVFAADDVTMYKCPEMDNGLDLLHLLSYLDYQWGVCSLKGYQINQMVRIAVWRVVVTCGGTVLHFF